MWRLTQLSGATTSLLDDGTKILYSHLKCPGRGLRSRYFRGFEVAGIGISHEWRAAVSSCGIVCCLSRLCSTGPEPVKVIITLFQHTWIIKGSCVNFTLGESASNEFNTQGCTLEYRSRSRSVWRVNTLHDHDDIMRRQYVIGLLDRSKCVT